MDIPETLASGWVATESSVMTGFLLFVMIVAASDTLTRAVVVIDGCLRHCSAGTINGAATNGHRWLFES